MQAVDETKRTLGTLVLAHPLVAVCVAVWLVNDHVLKAAYGSWWTGKLTDVVALIAFPLLVATAVERFVSRPLRVGIGFTFIFYSAINLWPAADAATEWLMSLVIESQLTMDPTDLLVLPALGGAWWTWNRVQRSPHTLRRSWGRTVFLIGVGTTMATSPPMAFSETFRGTLLLTEDKPSVSIPFTLLLDDEPAESVGSVYLSTDYTSFSRADAGGRGLDGQPIGWEVRPVGIGDGAGEAVISLVDPSFAPVEVAWTLVAETEGEVGLFFGGKDAPTPLLKVQAPPDEFGPEPLYELQLSEAGDEDSPQVWEWTISAASDAELALSLPAAAASTDILFAVEDQAVPVNVGFLSPIPPRPDCGLDRCPFSLWVSAASGYRFEPVTIALHGPAEAEVTEMREHQLARTQATFVTDRVTTDVEQIFTSFHDLHLPEPDGPIETATTFFRIRAGATPDDNNVPDDALRPNATVDMAAVSLWHPQPRNKCCDVLEANLDVYAYDRRDRYEPLSVEARIVVEVWSLDPIDADAIELVRRR